MIPLHLFMLKIMMIIKIIFYTFSFAVSFYFRREVLLSPWRFYFRREGFYFRRELSIFAVKFLLSP